MLALWQKELNKLRILFIMDPGILVPPKVYGGHERLVYMFAKEYTKLGHEVHLLVTKGSVVEGCTVHEFGKEGFPPKKWNAVKAIPKAWYFLWKNRKQFDLVHNFGRLAYLLPLLHYPVKKIMTYGREIRSRNIQYINKLPYTNLIFTGCSKDLVSRVDGGGRWHVVHNSISFDKYQLKENFAPNAPLMFLGRIEKIKGAHTAIEVAKATGDYLIIAGNVSPLEEERQYFVKEIEPHIDNKQIFFVGPVNDEQKNHWLGKAKALLFPIEWNEPFGMVMIEAMACGTPVIAFKKGSVPEVVAHKITGYVAKDKEEMIKYVSKLKEINRSECRKFSQQRFDVPIIASKYLSLFQFN